MCAKIDLGSLGIFFAPQLRLLVRVKLKTYWSMAQITPLGDRVVVKAEAAEEKTASGLFIPDTAKEKPQRGTVIAAGAGRVENGTKIDMTVKPGDTVLYGKYSGTEVQLDGEDYLIMRESDILGVIEG